MRVLKILASLAMLLLFVWIGLGCSNPDNSIQPDLPDPGKEGPQGDPMDPNIPMPFSDVEFGSIVDLAFEKDGDLVVSGFTDGINLYDNLGVFKRQMVSSVLWPGVVDVGPGWLDSGKSVIAMGTPIKCAWRSFYDDAYVTTGAPFPDCPT
jgi:hypothetical protein